MRNIEVPIGNVVESMEKWSKDGKNRDGNIFGLQDQATKALLWSTGVVVTNSFAQKRFIRLLVGKACIVV